LTLIIQMFRWQGPSSSYLYQLFLLILINLILRWMIWNLKLCCSLQDKD